jgi:hypothetical protein
MNEPLCISRAGFQDEGAHVLYLLSAESSSLVLLTPIETGTKHFSCFVAWDARFASTQDISSLARHLLDMGCVYFCCWGPDCERVHDIIDEEYLGDGTSINDDESTIMTSWHDKEPLDEALWFALNAAFPDDRFFEDARALIAICIGSPAWSSRIAQAFADPAAFSESHLGSGGDAA